jgi:osmotically-inducible protein OsmY
MRYSVATLTFAISLMSVTSSLSYAQQGSTTNQQQQASGEAAAEMYRQTTGEERFLRENRDVSELVGGGTAGVVRGAANATGQAGRALGAQSRGGRSNQFNQFRNMFGSQFGNQFNFRQQLRVPVRLGFTPAARPAPTVISGRVQSRLERIPRVRNMGSVSVQMDGSTAVLSGAVSTADDRNLLARVLLLEPGVSDVRNELQVATRAVELPSSSDRSPSP